MGVLRSLEYRYSRYKKELWYLDNKGDLVNSGQGLHQRGTLLEFDDLKVVDQDTL